MAKTQTQTTKPATKDATARKANPKAVNNTPVQAKAKPVEKPVQKTETKKASVYALVAGTIVSLEHKALKKAINYHVSKGNLAKVADGIKLTKQGADDWNKNRIIPNADTFQKIAAFVNGGANLPEFGGEKKTPVKVGSNKQLPSLEFWGSFSTTNMRLCFASLWATRK